MNLTDILGVFGAHISTMLLLNGVLTMVPRIVHDTVSHPRRPLMDKGLALAQLVVGVLTVLCGATYMSDVVLKGRPINIIAAPAVLVGGTGCFAQSTRNWPWSLVAGLGAGGFGALGIVSLAAGINTAFLAAALLIFFLLFYAVWYLTKPSEEIIRAYGKAMAWGPIAVPFGLFQAVLGILTGLGVWIL